MEEGKAGMHTGGGRSSSSLKPSIELSRIVEQSPGIPLSFSFSPTFVSIHARCLLSHVFHHYHYHHQQQRRQRITSRSRNIPIRYWCGFSPVRREGCFYIESGLGLVFVAV